MILDILHISLWNKAILHFATMYICDERQTLETHNVYLRKRRSFYDKAASLKLCNK